MEAPSSLQVLHEPERAQMEVIHGGRFRSGEDGGPPIILYKYSQAAVDFLHGFKGYYKVGYKLPDAKPTACWTHQKISTDAIPKGKALDYTQPSVQGNAVHLTSSSTWKMRSDQSILPLMLSKRLVLKKKSR